MILYGDACGLQWLLIELGYALVMVSTMAMQTPRSLSTSSFSHQNATLQDMARALRDLCHLDSAAYKTAAA